MSFLRFSRRLRELAPADAVPWFVLPTVDSTNSLARRVAASSGAGRRRAPRAVFVAYEQTHGRGRGDHRWESPAGAGAYVSLLLPEVSPRQLASLPLLAAVGVARGVQPLLERRVELGWPNDLLVGGRKLGGVLIESMAPPQASAVAVVGFGVNYDAAALTVENSTSLRDESRAPSAGGPEDLASLVVRLVTAVERELERLDDEAYAARAYAAASIHRPGERLRCRTPTGVLEGRFRGFDRRGFLRLETAEGERSMSAGELIAAGDG